MRRTQFRFFPSVSRHSFVRDLHDRFLRRAQAYREGGVDEGVRHDVARGGIEAGVRLLVEHPALLDGGGDLTSMKDAPRNQSCRKATIISADGQLFCVASDKGSKPRQETARHEKQEYGKETPRRT